MEDLSGKLGELLQSPDTMEKLRQAAASLGLSSKEALPSAPAGQDHLPDAAALMKLAPLLSRLQEDDPNTLLLNALRPFLHGEKLRRLEEAVRLLHLLHFMPLLREQGLL